MKKKFFLLFVSTLVLLFSVSSAMSAEYEYALRAVEGDYEDVELHKDDEYLEDLAYAGNNFKARFRLPALNLYIYEAGNVDDDTWTVINSKDFTVSWDISSDRKGLEITERTKDSKTEYYVLSGVLPEATEKYTYAIKFYAKVMSVAAAKYSAAVGTSTLGDSDSVDGEVTLDIGIDQHKKATEEELKKFIVSYEKAKVETVSADYSVTIKTTSNDLLETYNEYIESDDEYLVNLPEWLIYEVNATDPNTDLEEFDGHYQITSLTIKFNPAFKDKLENGEKAVVRVPLILKDAETFGSVLAWNVTFSKPEEKTSDVDEDKKTDDKKGEEDDKKDTPKAEDITSKVSLTDSNGASAKSQPYDSLEPGKSATYGISLVNSGVIAKTWAILINGTQSDTVTISGLLSKSAATSWAEITESTATTAKVKATPPSNLAQDSKISVLITDANQKQYTIDLGEVKKAATDDNDDDEDAIRHSGSGCNGGLGSLALAFMAAKLLKRHKNY